MTDLAETDLQSRRARTGWLPALALAANGFAIVTVTYWIFRARHLFIEAHPDYVARKPPTISRAIADPAIGEPFAFWITLCGALLVLGVMANAWYYLRLGRNLAQVSPPTARLVAICGPLVFGFQAAASVGMHILSTFRFPDATEMHMAGSYLFFIAQVLVVTVGMVASRALIRDAAALEWMVAAGHVRPGMVRARVWFGWVVLAMAGLYLVLFYGKDFTSGLWRRPVFEVYTLTEAMLITSFLAYLALFQTDLLRAIRAQRRP